MLVAGDGTAVGECGGGDTGWEVYAGEYERGVKHTNERWTRHVETRGIDK